MVILCNVYVGFDCHCSTSIAPLRKVCVALFLETNRCGGPEDTARQSVFDSILTGARSMLTPITSSTKDRQKSTMPRGMVFFAVVRRC